MLQLGLTDDYYTVLSCRTEVHNTGGLLQVVALGSVIVYVEMLLVQTDKNMDKKHNYNLVQICFDA